jgi:hypothetical protein
MVDEWKYSVQDTSTNGPTTILNVPALVQAVYINTALSAHTVVLKDGGTAVYTIPGSAAAGNKYGFGPTRFETSLVIDPDDSSTGNVTIEYRDLGRNE